MKPLWAFLLCLLASSAHAYADTDRLYTAIVASKALDPHPHLAGFQAYFQRAKDIETQAFITRETTLTDQTTRPVFTSRTGPIAQSLLTLPATAIQRHSDRLTLTAQPLTQVLSPTDGVVRFSGRFPTTNQTGIIIEGRNNLIYVLRGFTVRSNDMSNSQKPISAGTPLGRIDGATPLDVYLYRGRTSIALKDWRQQYFTLIHEPTARRAD